MTAAVAGVPPPQGRYRRRRSRYERIIASTSSAGPPQLRARQGATVFSSIHVRATLVHVALSRDVVIRGLAFVKHLCTLGEHQSRQPGLRGATALLTFHDAVEMLLVLGLQHRDAHEGDKHYNFAQYWPLLEGKGVHVTQKSAMQRLNKARVSLKHHALLPSPEAVQEFRVLTREFLIENTPIVFGDEWSFENLALSALVEPVAARRHLEAAEGLMAAGDGKAAMEQIACAFHVISSGGEQFGRRPFPIDFDKSNRGYEPVTAPVKQLARDVTAAVRGIHDSIGELQKTLRVLSLGLDFSRWQRFVALAPRIIQRQDERLTVVWARPLGRPRTVDECRECYDFVIDSAVRLQESRG